MAVSVLSLVEWFAYSCHTVMHVVAVVFSCHCLRQLSYCKAWSGSCHTVWVACSCHAVMLGAAVVTLPLACGIVKCVML